MLCMLKTQHVVQDDEISLHFTCLPVVSQPRFGDKQQVESHLFITIDFCQIVDNSRKLGFSEILF